MTKKEEYIEADILAFFMESWCKCVDKNLLVWYYNEKNWFYQKNKSGFVRNWRSDISVLWQWNAISIEVKKPCEMSFFDRPLEELKERYAQACFRIKDPKRYLHAVEQRQYLDDFIAEWWVWFFASSVDEVIRKLKENGIL